ncbi:cytochrome C oxidase subunit IV family protein [Shinella fusca]|uniref:Cytochrome c oxidase subunit 4 n=1 Tax=Shinella fusca TaxID=544480 RepID=A0A7W8DU24_9HYPH|nr:cytochrome C oxidase subunit IV family protein [Shinella fusca]MBB5042318.1 cytochrome c oxidase subunit 4 [Shinella fusca]
MRTASPVVVWIVLLALLGLTLAASFVLSGMIGLTVALAVASVKSGLVFWRYMHLREASGLLRIAALGALFWVFVLLAFVTADYLTRGLA